MGKIIGEYKDGKIHGQGTYIFAPNSEGAGDKYVGEYRDGKRNGQGTYTYVMATNTLVSTRMTNCTDKAPTLIQMVTNTVVCSRITKGTDKVPTLMQMERWKKVSGKMMSFSTHRNFLQIVHLLEILNWIITKGFAKGLGLLPAPKSLVIVS